MDDAIITKEKKRQKRRRIRKRIFFAVWASVVLILWIVNNHCVMNGVPQWFIHGISAPLKNAGYHIRVDHMRFSFTDGIRIKNLSYSEDHSGIQLAAPIAHIDFYPFDVFKGVFCPFHLVIKEGTATLPILPETGKEGKNECLHIKNLNVGIRGKQGILEVIDSSAKIGKLSVKMEGSINNFLHIVLENIFSEYWEQDKAGNRWKFKKYPYGIMQMFPIEIREKFIDSYQRFEQIQTGKNSECHILFDIDLNDFNNCSFESEIIVPEIQYEKLKIYGVREQLSLKHGVLELKEVTFDLGNGSSLTAVGRYKDEGEFFSGKIKGRCRITELMQFIEPELEKEIKQHITFCDELIAFNGILEHLSISEKRYKGNIELTLPQINVDGVVMKNVKLLVHANEAKLRGTIHHAELDGGEITGSFTIDDGGELLCELKGKANLLAFRERFPKEADEFIRKKITFSEQERPIEFSGKFRSNTQKIKQYSGSASIYLPHITYNGVKIQNLNAEVEFSPHQLIFSKFSAQTSDNTRFSGKMKFDISTQQISAKMVASGIPGKLAKTLDIMWQTDTLTSLAKDISSPDNKGIVETDVELFASYGKKKFFQISGNVVMRDPTYCGIPFQYGAARFITDSDNRLIIPDLILKSKDGTMQLESIYYGNSDNIEDGVLHFNLKSTIKGNDLLTIFCEDYKPVLVDFPYPINISAKGVIDYIDQKKTTIRAIVQNGACTFANAKITDIDAVLNMKNEEIFFKDAEMTFCKGFCKADFRYNFNTETGRFKQTLDNADLSMVLREFDFSDIVPAGTGNGKMSFISQGSFDAKDENNVYIYGKANLDIAGDELWDIPIMKDFLKYISSAWSILGIRTGITRINCDIAFQENKAVIKKVKANGDLVSMNASGEFFWNTGDYNITVYAELLKSALPFEIASKILTPISWMMSKNFKGKYQTPSKKQ